MKHIALRILASCLSVLMMVPQAALAQIVPVNTVQPELVKRSQSDQAGLLAGIVRKSSKDRACAQATASLEKTYDNGSGGWLVSCAENQDFWVLIPAQAKQAAIALPCILARATTGTDCYANIRTMSPDDLARCESGKPTADRAIRSCSAILQSG